MTNLSSKVHEKIGWKEAREIKIELHAKTT